MNERTCELPDCGKPHKSRGYCDKHYQRLAKHGDVSVNKRVGRRDTDDTLPDSKPCTKCQVVKPASEFYTHKDNRTDPPRLRLTGKCKSCHSAVAQDWNERNPERKNATVRAWKRANARRIKAKRYGIHEYELAAMEAAQQGVCRICRTFVGDGLVVDHCHTTGVVRGLLCHPCNKGLGHFGDDERRLAAALLYLRRPACE